MKGLPMKRCTSILLLCAAMIPAEVTMHFLGDCTIGCDVRWPGFDAVAAVKDPAYFFSGVINLTDNDDYTVANLETTIIDTGTPREKQFRFRGKPEYLDILKKGSVEGVTLANNHSWDYGDSGYAQTERNLETWGIDYFAWDKVLYKTINGISFAFIGQGFYIQDHVLPLIRKLQDSVSLSWCSTGERKSSISRIKNR